MFSSKKNKRRKAARIDTLIGENTHLKGDIHFSGGLRIDGVITGNITADEGEPALLTLSEKGRIEGEVRVPFQIINGDVKGNLYAVEHIELANKARINGNVFYKLLEMTVGSEVNGQLIHVGEAEETDLSLEHSQTDPNLNLEQQT